jgi:hypothetical protein
METLEMLNSKYQTGHDPENCCLCGSKAIYRMPHGDLILISANPQNPEFIEVVKGFCVNHRMNAVIEMQNFPLDKKLEEMLL